MANLCAGENLAARGVAWYSMNVNVLSHFKFEADLLLLVVCHLGHCLVCKQVGMLKQMGQTHSQAEQDMVVGLRYRYRYPRVALR